MGREPLKLQRDLLRLQSWMAERGLNSLHSISAWDQNIWLEWKIPLIPSNLKGQWEKLKLQLAGAAPIKNEEEDDFVWDSSGGDYIVKTGYKILQDQQNQQEWSLWKVIWKTECLPKIKAFTWTLLKGKILTFDILKKKKKECKALLDVSCVWQRKSQFNTFSWIAGLLENAGTKSKAHWKPI